MLERSYLSSPNALGERLFLTFSDDGWCDAISKDQTITLRSPVSFADFVSDPGAQLHPADERDRQLMLAGLQRYRDYLERTVDNAPLKLRPELAATIRNHQRGIQRLDAEILRLSGR